MTADVYKEVKGGHKGLTTVVLGFSGAPHSTTHGVVGPLVEPKVMLYKNTTNQTYDRYIVSVPVCFAPYDSIPLFRNYTLFDFERFPVLISWTMSQRECLPDGLNKNASDPLSSSPCHLLAMSIDLVAHARWRITK